MKIGELANAGARRLERAGVDSPRLCACLIMGHVLGLDRLACILRAREESGQQNEKIFNQLVARRESGEPLAYVLGRREFYGRDFIVGPGVLVPRPESELLIELALSLPLAETFVFADMGAGSGCLGVTLALERPAARGLLLDKSPECHEYAAKNANLHGLGHRLAFINADMGKSPFRGASLDLVLANPPYVGTAEKEEVMSCVLDFEPHQALFSGADGLSHIRALAREGQRILKPGGWIILEHGWQQASSVREILLANDFVSPDSRQDLAGLDRACMARKNGF